MDANDLHLGQDRVIHEPEGERKGERDHRVVKDGDGCKEKGGG